MDAATPVRRMLHGWGRTAASSCTLFDIGAWDLAEVIEGAGARGALARGLGRSYGDAAQNAGGIVVRLRGSAQQALLDTDGRTLTAPAGASFDDLLRLILPRGFFLPVSPGTRFVTVGGAIASDIHGKNHHVDGSFGHHLERITMMLADGSVVELSRTERPELFWATIGGMGLTGVILAATFRVLPVGSTRMSVDTERVGELDSLLSTMHSSDHRFRYSVAWIDLMAKGRHLGRSVLTRADHASAEQVNDAGAGDPCAYGPGRGLSVPPLVPSPGVINRLSVAAFNEMWFRKAPRRREAELQTVPSFFHPLDGVGSWNRLYGRRGLVQYQFVVPFGREDALRGVIERLAGNGATSFLAVLKRFGAGNDAPLSFPMPGWTLALDVPAGARGLGELLHGLDRLVIDAGGRHYMAKDAHTTPAVLRAGYPRLAEWQKIRCSVDPHGRWRSDLGRRLELVD